MEKFADHDLGMDDAFDALRSSLMSNRPREDEDKGDVLAPAQAPATREASQSAEVEDGKPLQALQGFAEAGTSSWILSSDDFKARRSLQRASNDLPAPQLVAAGQGPGGGSMPSGRASMTHAASQQYGQPPKKGSVRASIDMVRQVIVAPVKMMMRSNTNLSSEGESNPEKEAEKKKVRRLNHPLLNATRHNQPGNLICSLAIFC